MIKEFRLPDAGEGLTEAEIVSWKVKPGDVVKVNDVIVEIETAKSLVELPCPFAGVVAALLVAEGTTVDVGTPIISVDTDAAAGPPAAAPLAPAAAPADAVVSAPPTSDAGAVSVRPADASAVQVAPAEGAVEPGLIGGPAPGGRTSVLVGYGPREASLTRRARRGSPSSESDASTAQGPTGSTTLAEASAASAGVHVLAKPPVRKLARDLGIDLLRITPTGPGGVVTREDVEAASSGSATRTVAESGAAASGAAGSGPAGNGLALAAARGDRETRIPVKGVRRLTADAMVASAFTAPHVTEWVQVDVTRTMKLVERLRSDRAFDGVKVSPLLVVAKALLLAVRRNPGVNASFVGSGDGAEIVVKNYVNLGIAAATPRGLVVPNIKDADRLDLRGLADALAQLTGTAREGRTQPADMAGGTITITNVGVFGVDAGTPIINPGESAILAFGQVRQLPWVHKGRVRPRWVTTLAVSFDHRLVDGDLGSRFLADIAAVLEDPSRALVWT